MESTKSQLVLRSMDLDGRSLGTERSSTFQNGTSNSHSNARVSDALAGGQRFAAMLAGRAEEDGGSGAQVDLSARVREGRTDAATATYNAREAQEKTWKPRDGRTVERRDSSESWEVADGESEAQEGGRQGPVDADGFLHDGDASAAPADSPSGAAAGSATDSGGQPEPDTSDVHGLAGTIVTPAAAAGPIGLNLTQGPASARMASSVPAVASLAPGGALGGAAASRGTSTQSVQAVQATASTAAAKRAAKAAAPAAKVPPEDARAILNEVRLQILDGKREARIQLRPIELGRLDLLIRVDGQHVVAKIAAMNPDALDVLEAHAPELRAWLSKDGAESVELEFSLIESGTDEFAHQDSDGPGASFESAAERHALASSKHTGRSAANENSSRPVSAPLGVAGPHSLQEGVDFVA